MDPDTRNWVLKVVAIVASAVVVTWIANAPVPSREVRTPEPVMDDQIAALPPETVERIRVQVFDGLVAQLATAGLDAGWQLEDSDRVVLGLRSHTWPNRWAVRLAFDQGGLGGLAREEVVIERWIPFWPASEQRERARSVAQRLQQQQREAVAVGR